MKTLLLFLIGLWSFPLLAETQELSFQQFVDQYSSGRSSYRPKSKDPFDSVLIHAGIGYISSIGSINVPYPAKKYFKVDGETSTPATEEEAVVDGVLQEEEGFEQRTVTETEKFQNFQSGIQLALGIDLFSANWMAEGALRKYNDSNVNGRSVSLQEFDLKIVYQGVLANSLGYRTGAGLGARYFSIKIPSKSFAKDFSSPSSVLFFGLESQVSDKVSLGAEIANRGSLLTEAPDRSAFDLTLRMDAHF